jgi:hypothetical protein
MVTAVVKYLASDLEGLMRMLIQAGRAGNVPNVKTILAAITKAEKAHTHTDHRLYLAQLSAVVMAAAAGGNVEVLQMITSTLLGKMTDAGQKVGVQGLVRLPRCLRPPLAKSPRWFICLICDESA